MMTLADFKTKRHICSNRSFTVVEVTIHKIGMVTAPSCLDDVLG